MTFSLDVFVLIIIIFTFSQMIFSSSLLKSTKPTVSLTAEPLDDHQTFRLTTEQCPHLAKIFTSSGLVSATYLDSCSARFLHLDRLYDETLLLSISLDAWHHGKPEKSKTNNFSNLCLHFRQQPNGSESGNTSSTNWQ